MQRLRELFAFQTEVVWFSLLRRPTVYDFRVIYSRMATLHKLLNLNGTFSLGSLDLIKRGCCLNFHINLLTLLYSGTLFTGFLASSVCSHAKFTSDVPQLFCCLKCS